MNQPIAIESLHELFDAAVLLETTAETMTDQARFLLGELCVNPLATQESIIKAVDMLVTADYMVIRADGLRTREAELRTYLMEKIHVPKETTNTQRGKPNRYPVLKRPLGGNARSRGKSRTG